MHLPQPPRGLITPTLFLTFPPSAVLHRGQVLAILVPRCTGTAWAPCTALAVTAPEQGQRAAAVPEPICSLPPRAGYF